MKSNNLILKTALFMGIATASVGVANADITTGLVADFPFSGSATDVSGNNYSASVSGAVLTEDRNGKKNSAYLFKRGDYIQTDVDNTQIQNSMTISFWMKTNNKCRPGTMCSVHKAYIFSTSSQSVNGNSYRYALNSNYFDNLIINKNLYNDIWNHFVVTYSSNEMNVYLNGLYEAQKSIEGFSFQGDVFKFGKNRPSSDPYFIGLLDDIKIYNRTLSKNDVKELFNLSSTPKKKLLDIDDNGTIEAYSDHILLLRHNLGFTGDDLIYNATTSDCKRCSADEIKKYLDKVASHSALTIK